MKVVLFCGGMGIRLKDYSETIPKPLVNIGYRPILWHIMKYYAYYGFKDFILALGFKADSIKNYFINYDEYISDDFKLKGTKEIQLLNSDLHDWQITFIDTGLHANIGQRLKSVEKYLAGEDVFMANYADVLTDMPLTKLLDHFHEHGKIASFLSVNPTYNFHVVGIDNGGVVRSLNAISQAGIWMNGGYFIFKKEIFQYIKEGEDLVQEPFQRLIQKNELITFKYKGFWACMDTLKERQHLEDLHYNGNARWEIWNLSDIKR